MCFNSLTTMQLVVYAFCGLHSLNVLLLPGYMVSIHVCTSLFKLFIWAENLMGKKCLVCSVHSGVLLEHTTNNPVEGTVATELW